MNPILVDVMRGDYLESQHAGAVYVVDDQGSELLSIGDVNALLFPRSAIKIMQALPLVESGAAAKYNLNNRQLALACSSHNGEPLHTQTAESILQAATLSASLLECGAHMPYHKPSEYQLVRTNKAPCALHNNCSGKHAGMLAFAAHQKLDLFNYIDLEHPVQQTIADVISDLTEFEIKSAPCAKDGCSVPTWAAPLKSWAQALAKISRGKGLGESRKLSFNTLQQAVMAEPYYVAGTDRYCTNAMAKLSTPLFIKTGAEGVFCATLPEHGIGITLKCSDGSTRGAEMMLSATLKKLGLLKDEDQAVLNQMLNITLKNCNDFEVAHIKPAGFWGF